MWPFILKIVEGYKEYTKYELPENNEKTKKQNKHHEVLCKMIKI